jgi:hypothetical protein
MTKHMTGDSSDLAPVRPDSPRCSNWSTRVLLEAGDRLAEAIRLFWCTGTLNRLLIQMEHGVRIADGQKTTILRARDHQAWRTAFRRLHAVRPAGAFLSSR